MLLGTLAMGCADDAPQCPDGTCGAGSTGDSTGAIETDTDAGATSVATGATTEGVDSTGVASSGETGPTCECGDGEVCVEAICTPIVNDRCEVLWAPADVPLQDTVRLGLLMPRDRFLTADFEAGVLLAAQDLAALEGEDAPAWILCDTQFMPELETAGAEHLLEVGVVGLAHWALGSSVDALANEAGVLTMSLEVEFSEPLDPLRWSMAHAPVFEAAAVAERVTLAGPTAGPGETVVFAIDDEGGQAWADALTSLAEGPAPVVARVTDPADLPSAEEVFVEIAMAVQTAWAENGGPAATIIIITGGLRYEIVSSYLAVWLGDGSPGPFPRFVVTNTSQDALEDVVQGVLETPPITDSFEPLRDSIEGTRAGVPDPTVVAELQARYNARFGGVPPASTALAYDLAQALNLAVCASEEPSGAALAEVLSRLDGAGDAVRGGFLGQCEALASGASLTAGGASGSLTWDPDRQLRRDDIFGYGFVPPGTTPAPVRRFVLDPPPADSGTWIER